MVFENNQSLIKLIDLWKDWYSQPNRKSIKHLNKCWGKETRHTKTTYSMFLFYKVSNRQSIYQIAKTEATLHKDAYLGS